MKKIILFLVLFFSFFGFSFAYSDMQFNISNGGKLDFIFTGSIADNMYMKYIDSVGNIVIDDNGGNYYLLSDGNSYFVVESSNFIFVGFDDENDSNHYKTFSIQKNNPTEIHLILGNSYPCYGPYDNDNDKLHHSERGYGYWYNAHTSEGYEYYGNSDVCDYDLSSGNTYGIIPSSSSIISSGTFVQTGGGFEIQGMKFNKSGTYKIEWWDNSGDIISESLTGAVQPDVEYSQKVEGPGSFIPDTGFFYKVTFIDDNGNEEDVLDGQFDTPSEMFLPADGSGTCEEGFRKQIMQISGWPEEFSCPVVCFFPEQDFSDVWELSGSTNLSGATINNNISINLNPDSSGGKDFDNSKSIGFSRIGKTYSGSVSKDDFDFDINSNISNSLSKISSSLSGTFDNVGNMITLSGASEHKNSIGLFTGAIITNVNDTCEMFNDDGSFRVYGAGVLGISPNVGFNILQGNNLDYILFVPQKIIDFFTSSFNNILSLSSVFSSVPDNSEVCFLGFKSKVEYQKYLKIVNEGYSISDKKLITIGKVTYLDYFVLVVFGIIFVFGFIILFSKV